MLIYAQAFNLWELPHHRYARLALSSVNTCLRINVYIVSNIFPFKSPLDPKDSLV